MRAKVTLVLIVLAACAFGYRFAGEAPDLSSPKAAVRSFIKALEQRDASAMAQCVVDGKARQDVIDLVLSNKDSFTKIEMGDLVAEVEGDEARVAAQLVMHLSRPDSQFGATYPLMDVLKVRKSGSEWRLVPEMEWLKPENQDKMGVNMLRVLVALSSQSDEAANVLKEARRRAQSVACLSNAKQLGLGIMMYAQDYDEMLPRKKASYKDLIFPYVKNEQVFRCAQDAGSTLSYRFNTNMQAVSMAAVKDPAKTVMLYEGTDNGPEYRHEGRAAIVFADGHAKLMNEAEVKSAYWYPAGAKPAPLIQKQVKPQKKATTRKR